MPPSPPSGTVTFLLTDLEGSTRMWERNPQVMKDALAWHDAKLREAIERHDGYVFTTAGDAFCAAFDDPMRAAAAAVEIQQTMTTREWDELGYLKVRMGLDTGIAEERDGDYFGPPVNRAARIMSLADGGEVLASHTAADLLRHHLDEGIRLEDMGERHLKDVSRPEMIYAVAYGAPVPARQPETSRKGKGLWWAVAAAGAAVVAVVVFVLLSSGSGDEAASPTTTATSSPPATSSQPTSTAAQTTTPAPAPQTTAAPTNPPATTGPGPQPQLGPEALTSWVFAAPDDEPGSGMTPAVAVGPRGEKAIVYVNPIEGDLRVIVCRDNGCRTTSRSRLDAESGRGSSPAIAFGADGNPVVAYHAPASRDLRVAHCDDPACTSSSVVTVDEAGDVGTHASIAIGGGRTPVISYYDETNSALKVAHCGTPDCTTVTTFTVDDSGDVGTGSSIADGPDGSPVISYLDSSNRRLKVAHCDEANCSRATITTVDIGAAIGDDTAIVIGNQLPHIAYRAGHDVVLVRCRDAFCVGADLIPIETVPGAPGVSIAFGTGGVPIVSYQSAAAGLRLARCSDPACSTITVFGVDPAPGAGRDSSLAVLASGVPVIGYADEGDRVWVAIPEVVSR